LRRINNIIAESGEKEMTERAKFFLVKYKRVILYVIIGGINTAVDFMVFIAISRFTPLRVELCQAIGYTSGLICSFMLNRTFTFKDSEKGNTLYKIFRFIFVNAISLTVGMYGIGYIAQYVNKYIAKVLITFVTMTINYIGYKLFVFKIKER
jgi:putative flippase GtrA